MALTQQKREEIVTLLRNKIDFERSAVSARTAQWDSEPRQGEMPSEYYEKLIADIRKGRATYVIFSYQTPIAWVVENGRVILPEIKYSVTTSQHQQMVRDAYKAAVSADQESDAAHKTVTLKSGRTVFLTENESIILERMRDADGTEYDMVFKGPAFKGDQQKAAPRDQVEPLHLKGLVSWLTGVAGHGEWGAVLTDDGRDAWEQITKAQVPTPAPSQYSELTEDELIDLAAQKAEEFIHNPVMTDAQELAAITLALKLRRDIASPARRRVGEYLRHIAIAQAEYDRDMASGSDYAKRNAKAPTEVLSEVRHDEWSGVARLLLPDLQRIATPIVRDTEAEYFEEQERRLEHVLKHNPSLPEKQVDLLRKIAKGYVASYGSGSYSSSLRADREGVEKFRVDGRVLNALRTKKLVDQLPALGWGRVSLVRIKKPSA